MENYQIAVLTAVSGMTGGFLCFLLIMKFLPRLEKREYLSQRDEVLTEAQNQAETILSKAQKRAEEDESILSETLEASIMESQELLDSDEKEIAMQEQFYQQELRRIERSEQALQTRTEQNNQTDLQLQEASQKNTESRKQLTEALSRLSGYNADKMLLSMQSQLTEDRQLECQKVLKSLTEELNLSTRRKAQRILDRVHARYAPNFIWPKISNMIEITSEHALEELSAESCPLIEELSELSEASIKVLPHQHDGRPGGIIKLAGGYGIYREAARATLLEVANNPSAWRRARSLYQKHRAKLEDEALKLGHQAILQLNLKGIHPEIQKLVGALNWRTSYRQNQWHHTVEVAVLAGIIGSELGLNPEDAKRVGLLHDIGKALDYRIEGSHAVISGDYADRYGESRIICDTVMSHHADLLVETPLAYVLRAADTLSGARPGARVNLEEGYQIRLEAITEVVRSFQGITDLAIMNGGREVHIQVSHRRIKEHDLKGLAEAVARKIEEDVAYPGQIKVLVTRSFEASSVA